MWPTAGWLLMDRVPVMAWTSDEEALRLLGANLRTLRRAAGLSQAAVAELTGYHRTYIGSVERGERNVSAIAIAKLAKAVGAKAADIVAGIEGCVTPRRD